MVAPRPRRRRWGSRLADHVTVLRHVEAGRLDEAAAACGAILHRTPRDHVALRLLGLIRSRQGALDLAAYLFTSALAAAPEAAESVEILNDLAAVLLAQQDFPAALDCCRRALARDPNNTTMLHNHGSTLVALNRHAEALEQYRAARAIAPDSPELQYNEGVAMLALGMWPDAWERFDARVWLPRLQLLDRSPIDVPHWRGESDIDGKTILLQAEQGLGDTLQYIRYVPLVAALGAHVVARVQPALGKLLTKLAGADAVITFHDNVPAVDVQCPLQSLPLVFGTTTEQRSHGCAISQRGAGIPAAVAVVARPRPQAAHRDCVVGPTSNRRCGRYRSRRWLRCSRAMTWSSMPCSRRFPEADRDWLNAHPRLTDHSAELKNFADTAALASLMDLVVTIDTSVAHLAGALGSRSGSCCRSARTGAGCSIAPIRPGIRRRACSARNSRGTGMAWWRTW